MKRNTIAAILAASCTLSSPSWAMRPLSTDDAPPVEHKKIEVEVGHDRVREQDFARSYPLSTTIAAGLTDRIELNFTLTHETQRAADGTRTQGTAPSEIGMKLALFPGSLSVSFAHAAGSPAHTINSILSKGLGPLTGHLNMGYEASGQTGQEGTAIWGAALEWPCMKKGALAGEVTADAAAHSQVVWQGLVGANLNVWRDLTLDLGLEKRIEARSPAARLTVGATYSF